MAKISINDITSGYASTTAINNALSQIEAELNNKVLYRDNPTGEPNQMNNDLDMNGHRILNALASSGEGFIWNGPWTTGVAYTINALVSEGGSTYICLETHTAGTFALDLAAGKWELVASVGASGPGGGDMLKSENLSGLSDYVTARTNLGLTIGTDVQAYDANTAKVNAAQDWSLPQKAAPTTDNDLSFNLAADNNFTCTPTAGGTLTFTNIAGASGQSGNIILVNGSNYAIAKAATTKTDDTFLTLVSATGTYRLSYYCDGTNVYVSTTKALS